ncbi:hypothetical protein KIL84_007334 [Mauremys mutica]|uniref:Uncharacterized protein n=1 Tax=Mauremys mutica TaxID=74926 RepID=A0A9D3X2M0_9SAUR|nr:hypothetical protein KIL84_007334 [Mauremys mutica]
MWLPPPSLLESRVFTQGGDKPTWSQLHRFPQRAPEPAQLAGECHAVVERESSVGGAVRIMPGACDAHTGGGGSVAGAVGAMLGWELCIGWGKDGSMGRAVQAVPGGVAPQRPHQG